jgi:phosphoglycerate dehydrogenase-like enzyme
VQHTTMDLTPVLNQVLAAHDARQVEPYVFRKEHLDEFLQEAYRIVCHVALTRAPHRS